MDPTVKSVRTLEQQDSQLDSRLFIEYIVAGFCNYLRGSEW